MNEPNSYRNRVLIIDDEESIRLGCSSILTAEGYEVDISCDIKDGLEKIRSNSYDVILLDVRLPDANGIEAISAIKSHDSDAAVIIITGFPAISHAVEAIKRGAFDYLAKPFTPEQLIFHVERAIGKKVENAKIESLRSHYQRKEEVKIIAHSQIMRNVMALVSKIAQSDSTILITGESGTGKEVMARYIHNQSLRREGEFVAVDCSALVEGLIENELFGHVKGAFTGAWKSTRGSIELAHRGTLFLDEVANLSSTVQAKLLRTIQEKEVRRIGDPRPIPVDVRIIAATNRDLKKATELGTFREDLYYRLNVIPVAIPPLRERKEDILPLAGEFLQIFSRKRGKIFVDFTEEARKFMLSYHWPGNVRELRNLIDRAVTIEDGEFVSLSSLTFEPCLSAESNPAMRNKTLSDNKNYRPLKAVEADHILEVLNAVSGNKSKAARILGIDKKTLISKIKRYNLVFDGDRKSQGNEKI